MSLEIIQREKEGIEILDLKGRLTFGEEDLQLRNKLDELVAGKKTKVVFGMEGIHAIDSTAVGTLLFAQDTLRASGGGLALAGIQPSHVEVLLMAKLEVAFAIYHSDLDAINSFFPGREVAHYDVLQFVRSNQQKTE